MLTVTKKSVQNLLDAFGGKESIEVEHDGLMAMLGVPMNDDYEEKEEDKTEEYMGKMAMNHGMQKKSGPKMMALKIMLGDDD